MRFWITAAAAILAFSFVTSAQARGVTVDTRPLAARGAPHTAAQINAILTQRLRATLASHPGVPVVVRVRTVSLGDYAGGGGRYHDPHDFLEGDLIVPGRGVVPILISLPAQSAGAWYTPHNEARRIRALADSLAGWIERYR